MSFKDTWDYLVGSKEQFSFENRALHAVTLLGTILEFLLFLTNVIVKNKPVVVFIGIILVLAPLVHFLSRFKRKHTLAAVIYGFLVTGILITSYLLKVGSHGPGLFYFPIIYFIFLGFIQRRFRIYYLIGNVILLVSMLILEYAHPEYLQIGFISREILYADLIASVIVGLILTHFATDYIFSTFNKEHNQLIEANEMIRVQNDQLKQLNQEKAKLLSIMSHDLRGSLGAIQSLTELLTKYTLSAADQMDLLTKIQTQTKVSRNLLDNILFWAKKQISGSRIDIKLMDLEPLIREIFNNHKIIASQKNVKLTANCSSNLVLYTDNDYLHLILRNIAANAVKFTLPTGSVTIDAYKFSTDAIK